MAVQMQRSFASSRPMPMVERFKFSRYESVDETMSPPVTPSTPISPKEYDILPLTPEDQEETLIFLREFFFKDEPLNKSIGLVNEEKETSVDLEDFSLKDLDKGISLKAVYNGKIIGVCINGILERGYIEENIEHNFADPDFAKIHRILDRVAVESDVFSKFPEVDKAMTVKIVSVNGAFRGQGIAKELVNKTKEIAKEQGCGFITIDCSSHFTALAVKKLGFSLHYSLKYSDYKENGEVVFKPEYPHEAVTVYIQKI